MCPYKGCNGRGMPGKFQSRHNKIDWDGTVGIDPQCDEDEDEWAYALTKSGIYSEDQQSEVSDVNESAASTVSQSDLESGARTPTGCRSPVSMTEQEMRQVSLARHEQWERSDRRLLRREVRRLEAHPALRSSKRRDRPGPGWPDLGAIGAELDRALNRGSDFDSDESIGEFTEHYSRLNEDRARGGLHAIAQRGDRGTSDVESGVSSLTSRGKPLGSVDDSSISFDDTDFEARENRYVQVEEEQPLWEAYHLTLQRITAERFATAFPNDWPTEPMEHHIQTPQVQGALNDPSSDLSRFLYAMNLEAQIFNHSASEISRKLHSIREEPEYYEDDEDDAPVPDTSERAVLRWIEQVEALRPKLTKAMRRQFAECASSAERDELVFLLKIIGSEDMATEWVWRALCPNVSEYAQPQHKGEASLIEFTDPEGRRERAEQMGDSQLAGEPGDRPLHWNSVPKNRKGKEYLWNG